jgi:uncharacterized protein YlxW (UPF0749 family)
VNVFVSRISHNPWVTPVTLMCLVLGIMIGLARVTGPTRDSRSKFLRGQQQERVTSGPLDFQLQYAKLSDEVKMLQLKKTELEKAAASQSDTTKMLNENLQDAKLFAGLTELEGSGVVVTLRDSARPVGGGPPTDATIHDTDVLKVVNELWASGSEAISVNGHRVVGCTSFRCVGPVIHVDGVPIATPVVIRAIGDTDTLMGGLNLPLGVLSEIRQTDASMVQIEPAKFMLLPAYTGPTIKTHGKVPAPKK